MIGIVEIKAHNFARFLKRDDTQKMREKAARFRGLFSVKLKVKNSPSKRYFICYVSITKFMFEGLISPRERLPMIEQCFKK